MVEELTIKEAKKRLGEAEEIRAAFGLGSAPTPTPTAVLDHAYPVGEAVFIRCVTHYFTGRLVRVTAGELVLEDAAWVADTGRWSEAMANGTLNEVEPYPPGEVVVSRGGVVDVSRWNHALPREVR
jgi:hypothetical protein